MNSDEALDAKSVLCMSPAMSVLVESLDDAEVGEQKFQLRRELARRGWPAEAATHGVVAWRRVLTTLAFRGGFASTTAVGEAAELLAPAVWLCARARWRVRSARQRGLVPELKRARCAAMEWDAVAIGLLARLAVLGTPLVRTVDEMAVQAAMACGVCGGVKLKK